MYTSIFKATPNGLAGTSTELECNFIKISEISTHKVYAQRPSDKRPIVTVSECHIENILGGGSNTVIR